MPIKWKSPCLQVASRLAPCDLTSYPEGPGNVRTRLLVTSLACSCSTMPSSIVSWKWSSLPCASVQNRVQISVHSPVHESSPESRVQVLHQPRAEGDKFNHVIHKGLRSEINQLKIRCSNHGEGCQWTGELGELKHHLESDNGSGYVMVECPNKCCTLGLGKVIMVLKREDMQEHLNQYCYLRPYWCEFCGLKDTYEAITGWGVAIPKFDDNGFAGHQAKRPEMCLTCPNKCGMNNIKRKDMEDHRTQCPQEPVECPFAEAGCKVDVRRQQLEDHMTTSLQQHLMLLMIDHAQLKREWMEMKTELNDAKAKLGEAKHDKINVKFHETEDRLALHEAMSNPASKLKDYGDSMTVRMSKFSEYRRSGKVWHSPPFYYGGGYVMCLAVYANGVGEGAGTHVSVAMLNLKGKYDDQLEWPLRCHRKHKNKKQYNKYWYFHCLIDEYPAANQRVRIACQETFCTLDDLHMVNDCLMFHIENRTVILE